LALLREEFVMMRSHRSRILVGASVAVGLIALGLVGWRWQADWRQLWSGVLSVFTSPEAFRVWVARFGAWAPAIFFLVVAAQVIVAPIPGSIFPPVGAVAFGPWAGLALLMGGMLLGSACVFALTRRWGRPLAVRLVGETTFDRYARIVSANGGLWLFLIYLLPLLPDDAVSAVAGLSRISFRRFLLLSALGRLPGSALAVFASAHLLAAPLWVWLVAALAIAVGMALALRYHDALETWLLRRASQPT
jgi:uncharacterized membrane protein YdjX (TVP38/TMEM64 family)